MRDMIDLVFQDLRDEQGWDTFTCLGLVCSFIMNEKAYLLDELTDYLRVVAEEENNGKED